MKTIYLHIGSPKTATTSIQHFCFDNEKVLNSKGYSYPDFDMCFPRIAKVRNGHFIMAATRQAKDESLDSDTIFDSAFEKIYEVFKQYDNIVLSDEGLWNFGYQKNSRLWRQLKREIDKGIFQIKVIVYLRRQDAFLFSWWNQQVKEGYRSASNYDWGELLEKTTIQMDYYKMLENISSFVGKDNVIVRLFDRNAFYGGTIYKDFMHCIGLDVTDEYVIESEMTNLSLTKNNNEIKRILNNLPNMSVETNNQYYKLIKEVSVGAKDKKSWSMFSEQEFDSFMARYADGNQKIATEYLKTDKPLFDVSYNDSEKWTIYNEYILEDVIRFFGAANTLLMEENRTMAKEIKSLQKEMTSLKYALKHPFRTIYRKIRLALSKKEG